MSPPPRLNPVFWAGFAIGVAVDGLLDGAVLHQLLGGHHFLSSRTADSGVNMVADGWFHLAMLGILALGLTMAWKGRALLLRMGSGRRLLGAMLAGDERIPTRIVTRVAARIRRRKPDETITVNFYLAPPPSGQYTRLILWAWGNNAPTIQATGHYYAS